MFGVGWGGGGEEYTSHTVPPCQPTHHISSLLPVYQLLLDLYARSGDDDGNGKGEWARWKRLEADVFVCVCVGGGGHQPNISTLPASSQHHDPTSRPSSCFFSCKC